MNKRLGLALAGMAVLVILMAAGNTGAVWRDTEMVNPGTISTGELKLLVGGQEQLVFDALSSGALAPGTSVSAPLRITNGGDTDMVAGLSGVSLSGTTKADMALAAALALTVTDAVECTGKPLKSTTLYAGPLAAASFTAGALAPSFSKDLCLTVTVASDAPAAAAQGTTSALFTFRADQEG